MALSIEEIDDGSGMQEVSDIVGFNLYFGWYYRQLDGLGAYLDSLHLRHPRRPIMVSEYGADSDERIHTTSPVAFDFSTEHQQRFHETQLPQLQARDYLIGTAVWNQFDFGSKGRHDSKPNLNQKGLLHYDRTPKDIWYYHRALLRTEPLVHIASRDWPRRAGSRPEDARQPVWIYSNAPQVELLVNGTSLGTRAVQNATARWHVVLKPGRNEVLARGNTGATDSFIIEYDDRSALDVIAVNAGAHYHYLDAGGTTWEADRAYQPGSWGFVQPGTARLRHHRIYGAQGEHALYQAHHEGVSEYRFDVQDGWYEVRLLFTENEHDAAGARVFDVLVNGTTVFRNLDLAATYGRYHAVDRKVTVQANAGSGVRVVLRPRTGQTTISGIAVRRR